MESYLAAHAKAKACFANYSPAQINSMSGAELQTLCLEERTALAKVVMGDALLTSNIIPERINVLAEQKVSKAENRRKELDLVFK